MRRRDFVALVGGAAAGWPLAVRAQQTAALIGFLHQGSSQPNEHSFAAFRRGLQEEGFVEGRNLKFEVRWADGNYDRLPLLAADLVNRQPSVVAAALLPAARAAKTATTTIPIVFISGSDPIDAGLVTSVNRPTANITGVSLFSVPLIAKRLELLHELIPGATHVAVLINPRNPNSEFNSHDIEAAARAMGLRLDFANASSPAEFDDAFETIMKIKAGAALVSADGLFASRREQLTALAARHAIPVIYFQREFVAAGGLVSYGANSPDMYRQAGIYAARILKGAKPADLPILQPTRFELAINLKTATALGLTVPLILQQRADEVIE